MGDDLALAHLDGVGDLLLLGRIGGAGEIVAQLFHGLVARPAERRLVAARVDEAGHHRIEDIGRDPGGEHAVPAARIGRVLLDAARDDGLPVARLHVDLEAALFHQRFRDRGEVGQRGEVGRVQQHDRRAVVVGFLQQLARLGEVRFEQALHPLLGRERIAAHEHGLADLVVLRIADRRLEEVLLIEGVEQRLADLRIVERLLQVIGPEGVLQPERIVVDQLDVRVALEQRQQVDRRLLVIVDLAGEQRIERLLLIGDREPLHAVELDHLAARQSGRRLGARLVLGELDVDDLVAGLPFVALEHERAGPGEVRDLGVRIGLGDALRHHEGDVRRRLAEPEGEQAGRRLELDREGLRVVRRHRIDKAHQLLAERVARAPALDRGDAVLGRHRRAVVPDQAVAQRESVGELVRALVVLLEHLRLDLALLVHGEERVVDHVAVVARDVGGGPDRIDDLDVGMHHRLQGSLGVAGADRRGQCRRRDCDLPTETHATPPTVNVERMLSGGSPAAKPLWHAGLRGKWRQARQVSRRFAIIPATRRGMREQLRRVCRWRMRARGCGGRCAG